MFHQSDCSIASAWFHVSTSRAVSRRRKSPRYTITTRREHLDYSTLHTTWERYSRILEKDSFQGLRLYS